MIPKLNDFCFIGPNNMKPKTCTPWSFYQKNIYGTKNKIKALNLLEGL